MEVGHMVQNLFNDRAVLCICKAFKDPNIGGDIAKVANERKDEIDIYL
jgi:hypothetical protein